MVTKTARAYESRAVRCGWRLDAPTCRSSVFSIARAYIGVARAARQGTTRKNPRAQTSKQATSPRAEVILASCRLHRLAPPRSLPKKNNSHRTPTSSPHAEVCTSDLAREAQPDPRNRMTTTPKHFLYYTHTRPDNSMPLRGSAAFFRKPKTPGKRR